MPTEQKQTPTQPVRSQPVSAQQLGEQSALAGVKNILAIASGKGGVGKSTTTVQLAFALAKQGYRVGIVDADIYGPSIPLMTGVKNPEYMEGSLVLPPSQAGIKIISVSMFASAGQAHILRGPMAGNMVKQFLTQVKWGELDYLLIDYPPGTGDIQLTISQVASVDAAIIVTTPQDVALLDVRKAISMFKTVKTPILGIIETMSYFVCDECSKKHYIFKKDGGKQLALEFGLPLLGEIPISPQITEASDQARSLLENSDAKTNGSYLDASKRVIKELSLLKASSGDLGLESFQLTWRS